VRVYQRLANISFVTRSTHLCELGKSFADDVTLLLKVLDTGKVLLFLFEVPFDELFAVDTFSSISLDLGKMQDAERGPGG
jgi:hypothetical protein